MSLHKTQIQIRFSDIDMLSHVNNAKFPTYMELARMQYFNEVVSLGHDWSKTGIILAAYTMEFLMPVYLHDQLYVETEVLSVGTKSMNIAYRFVVESDTGPIVKATGTSVVVCFHYQENRSIPIPHLWKDKINEFQGTSF